MTEDAGRYKKMLQDLIIQVRESHYLVVIVGGLPTHTHTHTHTHTQSLFQLLEPKVVVQCRKCDLTVVKVSFSLNSASLELKVVNNSITEVEIAFIDPVFT